MSQVMEYDVITGDTFERQLTPEEAERLENQSAADDAAAEKVKTDALATTAAIAHAKSLGFTDAMIAVMYPNLGAQSE